MSNYIIQVHPNPTLQPEIGFFRRGVGTPEEPFHIVRRPEALHMTFDFAKERTAAIRKGHRARILAAGVESNDTVIIDWDEPLDKPQTADRETSHEKFSFRHRGIEIPDMVHNKILEKFYIRFNTSPNPGDPPDRSIAANSPAEAIDRFLDNGHTPAFVIDRYRVDDKPPTPEPAAEVPPGTPLIQVSVPPGRILAGVGFRPGNTR